MRYRDIMYSDKQMSWWLVGYFQPCCRRCCGEGVGLKITTFFVDVLCRRPLITFIVNMFNVLLQHSCTTDSGNQFIEAVDVRDRWASSNIEHSVTNYFTTSWTRWRSGTTVRVFDLRSTGCQFKSYSGQSFLRTLGKSFTLMCFCHQAL